MKGLFQCPPRATPWVCDIEMVLTPCKGKSFYTAAIFKAFALTGRRANTTITQGVALG